MRIFFCSSIQISPISNFCGVQNFSACLLPTIVIHANNKRLCMSFTLGSKHSLQSFKILWNRYRSHWYTIHMFLMQFQMLLDTQAVKTILLDVPSLAKQVSYYSRWNPFPIIDVLLGFGEWASHFQIFFMINQIKWFWCSLDWAAYVGIGHLSKCQTH